MVGDQFGLSFCFTEVSTGKDGPELICSQQKSSSIDNAKRSLVDSKADQKRILRFMLRMQQPCMQVYIYRSIDRCKLARRSRKSASRDTQRLVILFRLHDREESYIYAHAVDIRAVSPESNRRRASWPSGSLIRCPAVLLHSHHAPA